MSDITLELGDLIRLEFEAEVAHLAEPLAEQLDTASADEDELLRPLALPNRASDDLSSGAMVLEFAIATASGVLSGAVTAFLTARINALRPLEASPVELKFIEPRARLDAAERLTIRVTSVEITAEQQ